MLDLFWCEVKGETEVNRKTARRIKMRCLECDTEIGKSMECSDTILKCPKCGKVFSYTYNLKHKALTVREQDISYEA